MENDKNRKSMSIGIPSMVLIFITMCMSTLGILSLKKTQSDWSMAQKNAQAVREYYQADSKGEEFLKQAAEKPGEIPYVAEIPMRDNQILYIQLEVSEQEETSAHVAVWKVMNLEDYEIDNSMPVWDGV